MLKNQIHSTNYTTHQLQQELQMIDDMLTAGMLPTEKRYNSSYSNTPLNYFALGNNKKLQKCFTNNMSNVYTAIMYFNNCMWTLRFLLLNLLVKPINTKKRVVEFAMHIFK